MPNVWYEKRRLHDTDMWCVVRCETDRNPYKVAWLESETLADLLLKALEDYLE